MNFFADRLASRGQQMSFSAGRKIRVGTKAVSKRAKEAAQSNPAVASILKKVSQRQISFREADKELSKLGVANPFYPRNTREFHAHPWDMGVGSAAISQKLLELYGEMMEGDREPKLYKFPVVFPEVGGDTTSLIQGGMSVQGGGPDTIRYWSDYDAAGVRVCKHLPPVRSHDQAQRRQGKPLRMPERQPVTRGVCDPASCLEFQSGMCRFNGTVNFYIPGIPGAGVFQLHTGSTQAATEIYLRLTEAIRATNGKLLNFTPDGRPLFWITKVQKPCAYFDEDAKRKVGDQWVPVLDMEIEMGKVLWLKESGKLPELPSPVEPMPNVTYEYQESAQAPSAWMQSGESSGGLQETNAGYAEPMAPHQHESMDFHGEPHVLPQETVIKPVSTAPAQSADVVEVMLSQAAEQGYEESLSKWIASRYQGDKQQAAETWNQLSQRFGAKTREYISMLVFLADRNIPGEMVMKYLKVRFGPLGSGAKLAEIRKHLEELCADGASVAIQVMEDSVEAAST